MTTGLKMPSSYYMQLINAFPPRPITDDAELLATQARINAILDRSPLTQDDQDYLKVLGTLVYEYEERTEVFPRLTGLALLRSLMTEMNLLPQDLVPILEDASIVDGILSGAVQPSKLQVQQLATFFRVSPQSLGERSRV
ncbi:transcriptional regulator [Leptolyngbya boryana CZ1]|uniref:Transcriptional regulator n=1 Tax=Leptolyngbya boryana CZ1 TaxID=3060204 RepID=A0AA96X626_LEPBY|nr:transcriptional regulator [Leptolyngbya boryana]WNZ46179.1 transcriptional regulator [Leptolyngbya boryana CZ1]WNZ46250.1 transcriptional regulator [Leptolyngbya boryana CZ1]